MIQQIYGKITKSLLIKSVFLNVICQPISAIIGIVYVPVLMNYLGNEKYGVWATILSVICWINYFDIGIGNGLRNILTADIQRNDYKRASENVSTAYAVIASISLTVFSFFIILEKFVEWRVVFGTNFDVRLPLVISVLFICINFVMQLVNIQYYAIQKSEIIPIANIMIQLINLVGIILASYINADKLICLSLVFGISSLGVRAICTLNIWNKHRFLIPSVKKFRKERLRDIGGLGVGFFLIQISALILFSTDSLIISYLYGAKEVTPYDTVYKVFSFINCIFAAVLAPIWGRVTLAKEQRDFVYIKKIIKKLKKILFLAILISIIIVICFKDISYIWLKREIDYPVGLIECMAIFVISNMYSGIYSTILNGIGNIRVQTIQAVLSAIINIPLSIFFAKNCGLGSTGVCLATTIESLIGNYVFTILMKTYFKKNIQNYKE